MRRRFSTALAGRIVGALLQTAIVALLARALGVKDFAEFAVVVGTTQALAAATDLGFGLRVLQLGTDPDRRRVLGSLLAFRAGSVGLIVLATLVRSSLDERTSFSVMALFALYAIGEMLGDLTLAVWLGELRSTLAAGGLTIRRLAALIPLLVIGGDQGATSGLLAAGGLGVLMFVFAVSRRAGRPLGPRTVLRQNGALTLITSSFGIQTSDTALVGLSGSASLTAYYGAASRLANPINLAISTLTQVLIPAFRLLSGGERLKALRRARRPILLLALATAGLSAASPLVVQVLYGAEFAAAAPIVSAVFIGAAISAVAQLHLAYLVSNAVPISFGLKILLAVVTGLAIIAVSSFVGGALGASVGFVASQSVILLVIIWAYRGQVRDADAD